MIIAFFELPVSPRYGATAYRKAWAVVDTSITLGQLLFGREVA